MLQIFIKVFFNQAKKEKKVWEVGNKLTYTVVLYKTLIVLYILISTSINFICNTVIVGKIGFCDKILKKHFLKKSNNET